MTAQGISNSGRRQLRVVRCPRCASKWVAPGVRRGDTHVCKECGHSFVVGTAVERVPPPPGACGRPGKFGQ